MLDVRDVHSYHGDAYVLHGVSLSVPERGIVALLGRNGMGKTTLIRSVMGLRPPVVREGSITYRGASLRGLPPHAIARKGLGLVPQGRRLFASLTVTEHLAICPRSATPRGNGASRWTAERIFELFPRLGERRQHRGSQLSGGERQMLAIARALMLDPEMLIMDEPTEGLAPVMVQLVEATLLKLKQAGLSILLVEQNLRSALTVADSVFVLETGKVVYTGAASALAADRETMHRYLGV
jgi:branched-chain amino acid transport system ATP-binding protein